MNKILLFILFLIGVIFGSIFYTLASYYFRYGKMHNIKFFYIFLISIFFGIISYSIKVPIFYFLGKDYTIMFINVIFLITTFVVVTLYSKFILHEEIQTHTYIIFLLIVLLLILNYFINEKIKK